MGFVCISLRLCSSQIAWDNYAPLQIISEYFPACGRPLRVRFFRKIQDWILKSERIWKWILRFFTRQINPRYLGSWFVKGTGESTVEVDSSVPLTHRDPRYLGLICLVKKRKIHFQILLDLKLQSWIFVEKPTSKYNSSFFSWWICDSCFFKTSIVLSVNTALLFSNFWLMKSALALILPIELSWLRLFTSNVSTLKSRSLTEPLPFRTSAKFLLQMSQACPI